MLRVLICLSLVATITSIAFSILHVNALVVGFTYILAVLVVAARWELAESIVISVAAMPPVLESQLADDCKAGPRVPSVSIIPTHRSATNYFNINAFTTNTLSGHTRRNAAVGSLEAPGTMAVAAGASKEFSLREGVNIRFESTLQTLSTVPTLPSRPPMSVIRARLVC
jgi:hypothetical protein